MFLFCFFRDLDIKNLFKVRVRRILVVLSFLVIVLFINSWWVEGVVWKRKILKYVSDFFL